MSVTESLNRAANLVAETGANNVNNKPAAVTNA